MAYNELKTRPILKVCIFALVDILLSIGAAIGIAFLEENLAFRITIWVFCGVFLILGLILLGSQLFNTVEIKDNRLIRYRFFIPKKIKFSEITKIKNNNGVFEIYVGNDIFTTISSDDKASTQIILFLEKKNIKIDW